MGVWLDDYEAESARIAASIAARRLRRDRHPARARIAALIDRLASADGSETGPAGRPGPRWMDAGSAAAALGVSSRRARQLASAGDVRAVQAGGRWWFDPESVDRRARQTRRT
ncbi:MAG: hypothetical protein ACODAE_11510 [Gemmatimonadota bacterium]